MDITRCFPAFVAQPGGHTRLGCCAEESDDATTPLLSSHVIHDMMSDPVSLATSQRGIMHNEKDGAKRCHAVRKALTIPKASGDEMRHDERKCTTNYSAATQTTTELQISTAVQTLLPELSSIAIQTRVVRNDLIAVSMPDLRATISSSSADMPPLPNHIRSAVDIDGTVKVRTLVTLFSKLLAGPPAHVVKQPSQKTTTRYKPNTCYKSRRLWSAVRLSPNVSSEPFIGVRATIHKMKLAEDVKSRERYEDGGGDELTDRQNHRNLTYSDRHGDDDQDKGHHDCHQFRHQHPQPDDTDAIVDHRLCLRPGDISRATLPSIANIPREVRGLARFRKMLQIHRRPDKRTSRDTL